MLIESVCEDFKNMVSEPIFASIRNEFDNDVTILT